MALVNFQRRLPFILLVTTLLVLSAVDSQAVAQQVNIMSVGSLRSWFSSMGCEIEEGRVLTQQDGLEWPAYYQYQDCEAAKGLWIGTTNFTDPRAPGVTFTHKVVHIGPRVNGQGEFYPTRFEMVSRLDPPQVTVDGNPTSSGKPFTVDRIDPTLPCDRMLINEDNTSIGLHMTRKIMAWQQGYHDNYFIYDYVFTNNGNLNDDATIEAPSQTLTGVYIFFQYRYSPCAESRAVTQDHSSWGFYTMNDSRGDGLNPASTFFPGNADNDLRIQYSWHGRDAADLLDPDDLGASVWTIRSGVPFSDNTDTSGRLTEPQWVGIQTLHADRSASDRTDDPNQPSTTSYQSSDDNLNQNKSNSQFDPGTMDAQYAWMQLGHVSPRHADKVGRQASPVVNGDASLGTTGGFSVANGYGPYTLAPGDSIHIVLAEGVAGLSRAAAIRIGRAYKLGNKYTPPLPGGITAAAKDDSVYTIRDSLIQMFRRAKANFSTGYQQIPEAPYPPKSFDVTSRGDGIALSWDTYAGGPTVTGFRLYRAVGRYDGNYVQLNNGIDLPSTTRSYFDTSIVRGADIYYYLQAVGDPTQNTGGSNTPAGVALTSNRIFTQTYDPAQLRRQADPEMSHIRIVPNPFSTGAYYSNTDANALRFPGAKDRIAFFNIPGRCRIRIFTEMGELVNTIDHSNGSGDEYWNSTTSSNQVIVSGIYIVVFENLDTGPKSIQKLIVIR